MNTPPAPRKKGRAALDAVRAFIDRLGLRRMVAQRDQPDHAIRAGDELIFDDDERLVGVLRPGAAEIGSHAASVDAPPTGR
ncbi:MAG TPA: hypothetical protein VFR37_05465 [Longimicrobium sp.]|nr:hypothetical protein [Longimicrobium sp.]